MKTKLIIFDLDGTFYDIKDLIAYNFAQESSFLQTELQLDKAEADELLIGHHIYPEVKADARSCSEFFISLGLDTEKWNRIRSQDFPITLINRQTALSQNDLPKDKIIAIITNNTAENVHKILHHLNIDAGSFAAIITKENAVKDKQEAYAKLLKDLALSANEAVVIGDRYHTDILPMLKLQGTGVLIKNPKAVIAYLNGQASEDYQIFKY